VNHWRLSLALCLCFGGCNNPYGNHPPYPVSGQVLVNGEPAIDANITLYHTEDWGERTIVPQAWTDEEGKFALSTYGIDDGAPAGHYQVTIEWPAYRSLKDMGPDRLEGKYSDRKKSGLTADIQAGNNEPLVFNLKGDPAKVKMEVPKGKGFNKKKLKSNR
jgi:hypothetical protein